MSQVTTIIRLDDHGAIARLKAYPAAQKTALRRAINATARWARTQTVQAIVDNLAVKKSDLDGTHRFGGVTASQASGDKLEARVKVTGGRIPLYRFSGRPKQPKYPPRGGVSYQISTAGGRKTISGNAFTAAMSSGHVGFFRRIPGGPRVKIVAKSGRRKGKLISSQVKLAELRGPSIPQVASKSPEFKKLLTVDCGARLELETARNVNFVLTGTSKGGRA